jgi:hypothetical protein
MVRFAADGGGSPSGAWVKTAIILIIACRPNIVIIAKIVIANIPPEIRIGGIVMAAILAVIMVRAIMVRAILAAAILAAAVLAATVGMIARIIARIIGGAGRPTPSGGTLRKPPILITATAGSGRLTTARRPRPLRRSPLNACIIRPACTRASRALTAPPDFNR